MKTQQDYDRAFAALEAKADDRSYMADILGDRVDSYAYLIAELIRRLRPDLALLYADDDTVMVADLLAEHGPDGLVEELTGFGLVLAD